MTTFNKTVVLKFGSSTLTVRAEAINQLDPSIALVSIGL